MTRKTLVLEVDSLAQEALLLQYHAFLQEMEQLALTAPDGQVLDQCEQMASVRGQEVNRQALQQAVQRRIEAAEKKGRRCATAPAASGEKIAGRHRVTW